MNFIPVNEPLLTGNEKKYLNECIDTGWISSDGPFVKKFEELFAKRVDRLEGVAVANGTAALDIAFAALDLKVQDEVIMPTFTIISCAQAIVATGAKPVLVDCDPVTFNMKASDVEAAITSKTKAILVVHLYGLPVDMDPILELAKKYNLKIVEDAAEAIGLDYKGKPCGSFGDISTVSFYPNKHVTTGEGGMVLSNDQTLIEAAKSLRNLCFQATKRFVHERIGWNYRMSNLQAAVGLAQLECLDQHIEKKKHIGRKYTELLKEVPGIQLPVDRVDFSENVYWVYGIVLQESLSCDAEQVMVDLREEKIGTRPFFYPMHEQPVFRGKGYFHHDVFPVAERIARRGFYLPSGLPLTDEQIDRVVLALKKVLSKYA